MLSGTLPLFLTIKKRIVIERDYYLNQLQGEQVEIGDRLLAFLLGMEIGHFRLLLGYAGTGKTFLISRVIESLKRRKPWLNVAMTAPTNKAVKVLRSTADLDVDFLTIHQLLGLKPQINWRGEMEFVEDKSLRNGPRIDQYDVLIVDEVSMLNDELFDKIVEKVKENRIKVVFQG